MFSSGSAGSRTSSEIFSSTTGSAGGISAVGCSSVSSCSGAVPGPRKKDKTWLCGQFAYKCCSAVVKDK